MKSVLVNAPLDSNLHIHLIADNNAAKEIDSIASEKKWAEKGSSGTIELVTTQSGMAGYVSESIGA
jgi:hypothetical protein